MLTISQLRRAQRTYRLFVAFNVVSFSFMTGNVIFLYAMRLGAGTRLIGFLSSLGSITFFFSFFGRRIIRSLGVVKTRGYFWLARYLIMVPVLLTLIPAVRSRSLLALTIITAGYFGFNLFKGIALVSAKPIIGYISRAADRASFVSGNNMITFVGQIVTGLTMAFLLGSKSPLCMYGLFIAAGIIAGFFASAYSFRLPEPELEEPIEQVSLIGSIREASRRPEFSRLILLVMLSNLGIGMAMGFVVVYAKTVYSQADNLVVFFTVAGAVGALGMAFISRFMTDRIGSKPMYFLFNGLRILFLLPVIWAPSFGTTRGAFLFLLGVFFMHQMTTWGIHSSADLYFFATTRPKDRVDLGIVYNITRGFFGMIGSLGGGFLLGWLQGVFGPADIITPFRIHFALSGVFLLANLPLIARLPDVSDYSITDVLSIIFSPRDLKAIYFLNKLKKSSTSEEERGILSAMRNNRSSISMQELKKRLESPSFFVRMEALNALKNFAPDQETVRLLIDEISFHPYTTAHVAATMLADSFSDGHSFPGKLRRESVSALRGALDSGDYLLKSKAALSLAGMDDRESSSRILTLLKESDNPRILIYTVKALETMGITKALAPILFKIGTPDYPHLTNDLILSASGLLGIEEWFYPHYALFLEKHHRGLRSLREEIEDSPRAAGLHGLLDEFNREDGAERLRKMIGKGILMTEAESGLREIRLFLESQISDLNLHTEFLIIALLIYRTSRE
jgi:MFS family permease